MSAAACRGYKSGPDAGAPRRYEWVVFGAHLSRRKALQSQPPPRKRIVRSLSEAVSEAMSPRFCDRTDAN